MVESWLQSRGAANASTGACVYSCSHMAAAARDMSGHIDKCRRSGLWDTVLADLRGMARLKGVRLSSPSGLADVLMLPGTLAVLLFRLSSAFHDAGFRPVSRVLYLLNLILFGADLAPGTPVGPGLVIPHPVGVGFARETRIGKDVHLVMGAALGGGRDWREDPNQDGFPVVGDGCWISAGAKVLGRIDIGAHALIGPNALVMRSVPAGAIAYGNPARVIGYRPGFEPPDASGAKTSD